MKIPVDWLLEGEPWIAYRTRVDLLKQSESDPLVSSVRKSMLASPLLQNLVKELSGWPGSVIASHKSAGQPFHQLTFIADLGLVANDPGVDVIVARILENQSDEGPFQLPMKVSAHYGGTGQDQRAWALCDAPLIVYALVKFGLGNEPMVQAAIKHLTDLTRDNGWPCAVSKESGKFRGPAQLPGSKPFQVENG